MLSDADQELHVGALTGRGLKEKNTGGQGEKCRGSSYLVGFRLQGLGGFWL